MGSTAKKAFAITLCILLYASNPIMAYGDEGQGDLIARTAFEQISEAVPLIVSNEGISGESHCFIANKQESPFNEVSQDVTDIPWEKIGSCEWILDDNGLLVIKPQEGSDIGILLQQGGRFEAPWKNERAKVTKVRFEGAIHATAPGTTAELSSMFASYENMKSIEGIKNFNTTGVTKMDYMFFGCRTLSYLDLSSFDTSQVEDMSMMFGDCASLGYIELSSFDTSLVKDMSMMFSGCSSLKAVDVKGFSTLKVHSMLTMFQGCASLRELDLTSFSTPNYAQRGFSLFGCSSLRKVEVGSVFTAYLKLPTPDSEKIVNADGYWYNEAGIKFLPNNIVPGAAIYYATSSFRQTSTNNMALMDIYINGVSSETPIEVEETGDYVIPSITVVNPTSIMYPVLEQGKDYEVSYRNNKDTGKALVSLVGLNGCSGERTIEFNIVEKAPISISVDNIDDATGEDPGENETPSLEPVEWNDVGTCEYSLDTQGVLTIRPASSASKGFLASSERFDAPWSSEKDRITKVVFLPNVDAVAEGRQTSLEGMFEGYDKLESIDGLDNFSTRGVTDMSYMFEGCSSLMHLDLSSFDTSDVGQMPYMFLDCRSLESLTLNGFDTSNVRDRLYLLNGERVFSPGLAGMFSGCSSLEALDLSSFDTSNITCLQSMFKDCSSLTDLNVSSFDVSKLQDRTNTSVEISAAAFMFYGCSSLKLLDLSNFRLPLLKSFESMFSGCSSLEQLILDGWVTSSAKTMAFMFHGCESLTTLDLSSFDTSRVTDMMGMFFSCSRLATVNLSPFDTSNVVSFTGMFQGCAALEEIDLSSFNTASSKLSSFSLSTSPLLRKVCIGEQFTMKLELPSPSSDHIEGADGRWYDINGTGYAPDNLPSGLNAQFFASKKLAELAREDNDDISNGSGDTSTPSVGGSVIGGSIPNQGSNGQVNGDNAGSGGSNLQGTANRSTSTQVPLNTVGASTVGSSTAGKTGLVQTGDAIGYGAALLAVVAAVVAVAMAQRRKLRAVAVTAVPAKSVPVFVPQMLRMPAPSASHPKKVQVARVLESSGAKPSASTGIEPSVSLSPKMMCDVICSLDDIFKRSGRSHR